MSLAEVRDDFMRIATTDKRESELGEIWTREQGQKESVGLLVAD